jgi:hypothetical protein
VRVAASSNDATVRSLELASLNMVDRPHTVFNCSNVYVL